MAEAIGTAASLIALFSLCIDSFEFYQSIRHHDADLHRLTVRLGVEKCRLYIWGEAMGLTRKSVNGRSAIERCRFPEMVEQTLRLILEVLDQSDQTLSKYGCRIDKSSIPQSTHTLKRETSTFAEQLRESFGRFDVQGQQSAKGKSSILRKVRWVSLDSQKFEKLVYYAKDLIDGLQDITRDVSDEAQQQKMIARCVEKMGDVSTLQALADACRDRYPIISDAASSRADTLTSNDTAQRDVLDWANTVETVVDENYDDDQYDALSIEAMESMTVTELKHYISTEAIRNKARKQQSSQTSLQSSYADIYGKPPLESAISALSVQSTDQNIYGATSADSARAKIVSDAVAVTKDLDFRDEVNAIETWFKVLTASERMATMFFLWQHVTDEERLVLQNPEPVRDFLTSVKRDLDISSAPNDSENV